jgi:hypothetical protein
VLRAAWKAHGDRQALSPTAVDVRSHRVRGASWLLAGVRGGQALGDLLGYRFERALHELGADDQIRAVRQQVLSASGAPEAAPDEPVDGLALLELRRADRLSTDSPAVRAALAGLEEGFDAVNDLALVEAVHQLTGGNHERARAVLDAVSTGSRPPPEFLAPRTPRSGRSVDHRVVVLLDPQASGPAGAGWVQGVRDRIVPGLEPWVASLLPAASEVGVVGTATGADGATRSVRLTLAELGLSALDTVYLMEEDPARPPVALATLAALAFDPSSRVTLDPHDRGDGAIGLAELAVPAVELRRALATWRPLEAADLRSGGAPREPTADRSVAEAEALAVARELVRVAEALGGTGEAAAGPVGWLARLGLAAPGGPADLEALRGLVGRRLARVQAVEPADPAARLAGALGARLPLLGVFPRPGAGDPGAVAFPDGLATPEAVDAWLDAVDRVRPEVGRLTTPGLLSELLSDTAGVRAAAGQSPIAAGEGWAAVSLPPPGAGPRLCVTAAVGPGGVPADGRPCCGLVVDQWVERIPGERHVAGLAVQFDAPSNRPPQSWLLAVTPEGEPWSLSLVVATLLETLEWAVLRGVAPEDLLDYGRALPTVHVPGLVTGWPASGGEG